MFTTLIQAWRLLDSQSKKLTPYLLLLTIGGAVFEAVGVGLVFQVLLLFSRSTETSGVNDGLVEDIFSGLLGWAGSFYPANPEAAFLAMVLIFFIVKNLYLLALLNFQLWFGWNGRAKFGSRLYQHYFNLPYESHLETNNATITRNLTGTISDLYFKIVGPTITLLTEILVSVSIISVLTLVSFKITMSAFFLLLISGGFYYFVISHRMEAWGRKVQESAESVILWANQGFGAFKEARLSNSRSYFISSFHDNIYLQSSIQKKILLFSNLPRFLFETIVVVGVIVGVYLALPERGSNDKMLPVLGIFAASAFRLMPSANKITLTLNNIRNGLPAVEILHKEMEKTTEAVSTEEAGVGDLVFRDSIYVEEVSFQYQTSKLSAVSEVSFEIKKGESVAFVGSTGAGKTTLVDIVLGLLQPKTGRILLDGKAVSTTSLKWRSLFGYVPQDIFLVDDTLRNNIIFGRHSIKDSKSRISKAIELAQLSTSIVKFPEGLDTVVGERGARISGGQRQRIGIARALFGNPQVLVFDEATSALDNNTELELIEAMERFRGKMTIIVIAHRMSSVMKCDRIFLMDNGRVVDQGSFRDLSERNELFKSFIDSANPTISQSV